MNALKLQRLNMDVMNGEFYSDSKHVNVSNDWPDVFEDWIDEEPYVGIELVCGYFDSRPEHGFVKIQVYGPNRAWKKVRENLSKERMIGLYQAWFDNIYDRITDGLTAEMLEGFGLKTV